MLSRCIWKPALPSYSLRDALGNRYTRPLPAKHTRDTSASRAAHSMATTARERAKGAIIGSIVADAATMGLHWIYDVTKIDGLLESSGKAATPEFFEPPSCPYYQMPSGTFSPYGAEAVALLQYLATNKGIDGPSWTKALYHYFKNVYPGYKNHSIKNLLSNVEAGEAYPDSADAEDTQADNIVKVGPVTGYYASSSKLTDAVTAAIRAQQNNDTSVTLGLLAAKTLEKVIVEGVDVADALKSVAATATDGPALLEDVLGKVGTPLRDVTKAFGASCQNPGATKVALVAALSASSFEEGIRSNIVAGGDNCSRSSLIGALLGARYGYASIPAAWKSKVTDIESIEAWVDQTALADTAGSKQ